MGAGGGVLWVERQPGGAVFLWCQHICCGGRSPASALRGSRVQACGAPTGERLFGNYLSPMAGSEDRLGAVARGAWSGGRFFIYDTLSSIGLLKKTLR